MTVDPDLALIVGIGLVLLSLLSIVAAWIDARLPVWGGAICAVGLMLVALALIVHPQGYRFGQLPDVFFTVLGRYVF
ncbi:hypothetical protein [Paragemmobacter straminiformis]|uniref:Uncharacterized protein n=1 Tax=Paragemmobacter straminiformis TaxID=2045119 RepID=A0A842IBF9_9RHOB|nr:hypothetical protein [Gemmobacter straminiformis]MBC2836328.1 hypothetical protein [Gemmobacter straminiformis]